MMKYNNIHLWRVYINLRYLIPLSSGVYCPHPAKGGTAIAKPNTQVIITALLGLRCIAILLQTLKTNPE